MRRMQAKFSGICRKCNGRISVGDSIVFLGSKNAQHSRCYDGEKTADASVTTPTKAAEEAKSIAGNSWAIDWPALKTAVLRAFEGDFSAFPMHRSYVQSHCISAGSWQGYTGDDVKRWLQRGFQTDAIRNLGDFDPPLRKKRRIRFTEEGDEFHYDLAASGEERFMSEFTKRDRIPGASVQIHIGFAGSVDNKILTDYAAWVCKAIYALDLAGVDTEIIVHTCMNKLNPARPRTFYDTRIRVKKENEVVDFNSFSAMFSPAQYRAFMFTAQEMHMEARGQNILSGHGSPNGQSEEWKVQWNADDKRLEIVNSYFGGRFPAEKMEKEFRQALKDMTSS